MIRYRTDGTNPQNKDDGSPIPNGNDGKIAGSPGQNMSYVHTNLDPTKHYYYSAFSYDISNNYSQTAYADAQPLSPNNAPVIQSFTGVPSSLNNPGESTTFNVSATDPDGDSLTYTINFGDGTANGSGSEVVHTYETKGTYTATATVNDGNGNIVGKSLQVTVSDIRPAELTKKQKRGASCPLLCLATGHREKREIGHRPTRTHTDILAERHARVKGVIALRRKVFCLTYINGHYLCDEENQ